MIKDFWIGIRYCIVCLSLQLYRWKLLKKQTLRVAVLHDLLAVCLYTIAFLSFTGGKSAYTYIRAHEPAFALYITTCAYYSAVHDSLLNYWYLLAVYILNPCVGKDWGVQSCNCSNASLGYSCFVPNNGLWKSLVKMMIDWGCYEVYSSWGISLRVSTQRFVVLILCLSTEH